MKFEKHPAISIVIPALDEAKTIKKVILDARNATKGITKDFEILVMDDYSTDNTLDILKKMRMPELKVFHHKENLGIEQSLRDLYKLAKNELVFFNGADGDIDMQVLQEFYKAMKRENADIVVGNRKFKNYTLKRNIVSNLYNNLVWILTGVKVYDAGTVKLVKLSKYHVDETKSKSVFAEAERLVRSVKKGAKLITVDIQQNKNNRNDKVSILQLIDCLSDLIKLSFEMAISAPSRRS